MDQEIYSKFARVLVEAGANLQPGETLIIQAQPEEYRLVREIAAAAYRRGARFVKTEYEDQELSKIRAAESEEEYLDGYPQWLYQYRKACGEDNICMIRLHSPGRLEGSRKDYERFLRVGQSERNCEAGFTEAVSTGKVSIVKTTVPCPAWAELVYPQLEKKEALHKLWTDFASICRLDEEDPVKAWRCHQETIFARKEALNRENLQKLYFNSKETHLEIGLVRGGKWIGGCAVNQKDQLQYIPNIPTEEIFFVPHKYQVNGEVVSTVPLNYKGSLIEGIHLEVANGKVVGYSAQKGEKLLASILETDQGSRYFGEVSLVPVSSPIYQTHTVFYDTLLDENATCHMALGKGTPGILDQGYELDPGQREDAGINDSSIHVDFMVGSEDLYVDGLTGDGRRIPIMRKGEWVI